MSEPRNDRLSEIERRVASRELKVAVVGLGYVGLPLAVQFARSGFRVIGVDVDDTKIERLGRVESYIDDVPSELLAEQVAARRFEATSNLSVLSDVDAISICVPTPLSKSREPDLAALVAVGECLKRTLRPGQLVVLESTTYPGTTEEMLLPVLDQTGLSVGSDYFLAFSPERIDPGRRDYMVHNTPRVIGGVTAACLEAACAVYGAAIQTVIPVSSPRAAEMTKLIENTFRSVNIALANEAALMCDRLGISIFEVIKAASSKPFGFLPFFPGPGIGGHCLPVDPIYLSWKMRSLDYKARFIDLAEEINRFMPHHLVGKVVAALNRHKKPVNGSRVMILGVAYKPDVDDVRESPAIDVIRALKKQDADVCYHDPHIPAIRIGEEDVHSVELTDARLEGLDCAVIVTDHSSVDYVRIVESVTVVVDARNATASCRHLGDVVTI